MQRSLGIIAVVGMMVIPLWAASQSPSSGVPPREGFAGNVTVLNKGTPESVPVSYQTWFVPQGTTVDDLAGGGNRVVEVASGALTTIIDGQKQARKFGEFFVVPAGHKLQVVTTDRSAILHTLRLGQ